MKPIIRAENLSKQFHIGAQRAHYKTLRASFAEVLRNPFKRFETNGRAEQQTIWALKDVNFVVRPGEVVGIIGRNGAGKSTLLKILSRITEPTTGTVDLYGRVASLLEVGTGFHPELSGRDNILLNGAILGMGREEIARNFAEIVAFAEIEKFIDTPVKHYSSGMYTRLAFAVAAHLESEILIVDEVLAVGDTLFQKKCLGKMSSIARGGRTVLFVSHNLGAVSTLCARCLLLENGTLIQDGSAVDVVEDYQASHYKAITDATDLRDVERDGTGKARFTGLRLAPVVRDGVRRNFLRTGEDLEIEVAITAASDFHSANVALVVSDTSGYRLIDANTALQGSFLSLNGGEQATVRFHLQNLLLKPGVYILGLWLGQRNIESFDSIPSVASITVEADPKAIMNHETFPGVYQCKFLHDIRLDGPEGSTTGRSEEPSSPSVIIQ